MDSAIPRFYAPANINDFEIDSRLADKWNDMMTKFFEDGIKSVKEKIGSSEVSIFNPRKQPPGQLKTDHITWGGFPNTLRARYPRPKERVFQLADNLATFGKEDDFGDSYPSLYTDPQGRNTLSLQYRQQDEYLEWTVQRDELTGKIREIIFTCEGPEYWEVLAENDEKLLLDLYKKYASKEVTITDLRFSNNVYEEGDSEAIFKKGDYNPYNKWNLSYAIHLTHPANTLSAEVILASDATVLRMKTGWISYYRLSCSHLLRRLWRA